MCRHGLLAMNYSAGSGKCGRRELVLYCSDYNSQLLLLVMVLLCLESRLRVMCFTDIY